MRALVVMCLLMTGCGVGPLRRASAPPPPPGPTPVRIPEVTSTDPAPPPRNLPPPPPIATPRPDAKPGEAAVLALPKTPNAKPPRPPRPRRAAAKPVAPPPPPMEAAVAAEPVPVAPAYRLGELRPQEEREKLRRQSDHLLNICARALAAAEGRTLTAEQNEMANRIRGFAQQARESMDRDPEEARNLAAKGKSFADSLLAELK